MAQKPLGSAAAERMNLVAQDEIWKYRLKAESEARKNWAQNWGFLTTPLEELIKGEEESHTPKPRIQLPERFHIRQGTPVEKYIKEADSPTSPRRCAKGFIHNRQPTRDATSRLARLEKPVLPSPPVPQTTQGFIGWRSTVPGLNKCLELDYEIRSCKGAYARELGWPKQGIY